MKIKTVLVYDANGRLKRRERRPVKPFVRKWNGVTLTCPPLEVPREECIWAHRPYPDESSKELAVSSPDPKQWKLVPNRRMLKKRYGGNTPEQPYRGLPVEKKEREFDEVTGQAIGKKHGVYIPIIAGVEPLIERPKKPVKGKVKVFGKMIFSKKGKFLRRTSTKK